MLAMYTVSEIKEAAKGRWGEILPALGVSIEALTGEHLPCPGCGGIDRFRFDDIEGRGTWICSQGNGQEIAGDGFDLLKHVHGWDFATAVKQVGHKLGLNHLLKKYDPPRRPTISEKIFSEATPDNGRIAAYLKSRGLRGSVPEELRLHPRLNYYEAQKNVGTYPAMVAPVMDVSGAVIGVHTTYLSTENPGRADIKQAKKMQGAVKGGSVRLSEATENLRITEGIETGVAVLEALGGSVWVALSAGGIDALVLPPCVKNVEIWADNDINETGQKAAEKAARRWTDEGLTVRVIMPSPPCQGRKSRDWLDVYNEEGPEVLRGVCETAISWENQWISEGGISAKDLVIKAFEPLRWAVPSIIPDGLTILAGPPKIGKSWLCLDLCLAIALGGIAIGTYRVEKGRAIYLALEDSQRRLKDRLKKLLEPEGLSPPDGFDIYVEWPAMDEGGATKLDVLLKNNPDARIVIIDTFQKVRRSPGRGANAYAEDYKAIGEIKTIADKHKVAIVVVHHLRKTSKDSDDPLEAISGSMGLSGAADATIVLKRDRAKSSAVLFVAGRDVEEQELAVDFDKKSLTWKVAGEAKYFREGNTRQTVRSLLKEYGKLKPKELGKLVGIDWYASLRHTVSAMKESGDVKKEGEYYVLTEDDASLHKSKNYHTLGTEDTPHTQCTLGTPEPLAATSVPDWVRDTAVHTADKAI